jgi:uncharacterized protein
MRRFPCRPGPALALALLAAVAAAAQIPASPSQWVTDTAGFLTPQTVESLNADLRSLDETTGHQILVYIAKTTAGMPPEDFATRAFNAWKPGRKGLDDGLILFIFSDDRKIRIEVGYGIEDRMTDLAAGRIINEVLVPRIQAGDRDGAVREAVVRIKNALGAGPGESPDENEAHRRAGPLESALIVIGIIIFLILLITHPSLALWLLFNILGGGGRGGSGGFGGGGFRGGGGRSGGGGASGGW